MVGRCLATKSRFDRSQSYKFKDEPLIVFYDPQKRSDSTVVKGVANPQFNAFTLFLGFATFFLPMLPRVGPRLLSKSIKS